MSKTRYIKTDFWSDSFIEWLTPTEKLLFIYLFSNERVDLCWIYEISLKKIAFESWIDLKDVIKIMDKFSKRDKVYFIDWYIYIKNFVKHLQINPSIKLWIERSRNALPKTILEAINNLGTACIQDGTLIPEPVPEPVPILWLIHEPSVVATQPNEYLLSINYLKNYSLETEIPEYAEKYRDEWIKFCIYWWEKGKTGKIRAEWEKTFEIKKRFATWMSRKKDQYQQKQKESALDITL